MSFMAGGSADCGPANPMSGLMKQFQQDRSLQQDRFALEQRGEGSKPTFRSQNNNRMHDNRQFTDEFFREESARKVAGPFEFSKLNQELESIQPKHNGWAADFAHHQQPAAHQQFEEFEKVYQQKQPLTQQLHNGNWASEFSEFQTGSQIPILTQTERVAFEKAFDEAKQVSPMTWENEFAEQESWASEFAKETEPVVVQHDNDALARTAGMLLDSVDIESNPKFKNSQFMNLMRRLRDSEVKVEGNTMVESKTSGSEDWASQFTQQAGGSQSGNIWSAEFAKKAERGWTDEFHHEQKQHQFPGDWASEFNKKDMSTEQMQELFGKGTETDDWVQQYNRNISHLKESQDHEWDSMQKDWDKFKPEQGLGYRATQPEHNVYNFAINNPFLIHPESIQSGSRSSLAESILATEARVQLQTSDSGAWKELGLKQQENERDAAAIAALKQAVKLNPSALDAWMALAVSYTNENCRSDAYDSLEQWIANHNQYRHLSQKHGQTNIRPENRHAHITSLFIEAARSSPGAEMDPDVQVGLGVLFNVSGEYMKAIDCFKAALASKPQDYLLWNKLGATLANSRNPTDAIDAYFNALEINPSYVRARYNLAISCINLGQHREAAEHLLNALALQRSSEQLGDQAIMVDDRGNRISVSGGMSDNVWSSLRMLMLTDDLAQQCETRNLDAFRRDFEF
ncbi:hypothetical protein BY458DRAFT_439385 [Sporodiniella umbellata]|nr:hypothetical protein BY458DRAFT_439385 [Sporodiniella umbellata]